MALGRLKSALLDSMRITHYHDEVIPARSACRPQAGSVSRGSRAGGGRRPGWPRCGHEPAGRAASTSARSGSGTAAWPVPVPSPSGQLDQRRRRTVALWPAARRPAPRSGSRAAAPRGRPPAPVRGQRVPGPSAGRTAPRGHGPPPASVRACPRYHQTVRSGHQCTLDSEQATARPSRTMLTKRGAREQLGERRDVMIVGQVLGDEHPAAAVVAHRAEHPRQPLQASHVRSPGRIRHGNPATAVEGLTLDRPGNSCLRHAIGSPFT